MRDIVRICSELSEKPGPESLGNRSPFMRGILSVHRFCSDPWITPYGAVALAAVCFMGDDHRRQASVREVLPVPSCMNVRIEVTRSGDGTKVYGAMVVVNCAQDLSGISAPVAGVYSANLLNTSSEKIIRSPGSFSFKKGKSDIAVFEFSGPTFSGTTNRIWAYPGQNSIEVSFKPDADPAKPVTHRIEL